MNGAPIQRRVVARMKQDGWVCRHIRRIDPDKLCEALPNALIATSEDMEILSTWKKIFVQPDILMKWVDGPLKETWGIKAAARVLLICSRGVDGGPDNAFSLFDVSQALAWIAKERNEV